MRVEPGRDEQQIGLESADRTCDRLPGIEVAVVARPGREGDVHEVVTLLVRTARARVERPLVQRHEENRIVAGDDVLRSVAVVDVPVDDRDALQPELRLCPPCGDRHAVEQAEAHRTIAFGVVPGRTGEREPAPPRCFDCGPRSEECRVVRGVAADRVGVDPPAGIAHELDQLGRVAAQDIVLGGGRAFDERKPFVQHHDPLLRFGM